MARVDVTATSEQSPGKAAAARLLVDAAEERFALDGIGRASLRAVMRDAGTDPGAIHYHFRGREALAEAVLDRVLVPLNNRRLELLASAVESGPPGGADLVDALVRPDVEAACALEARGPGRARLMGAIYLAPESFVTDLVRRRFVPVATAFQPYLAQAFPGVGAATIAWRVRWCVFGTLGAVLADADEHTRHRPDDLVRHLVDTLTPALAGPTTGSSP